SFDEYCLTRARHYQLEQRWSDSPFWRRRQNRVTLSPHARIVKLPICANRRAASRLPADLRHVDAALLCAACERPRAVHEGVAYQGMRAERAATDVEVTRALQWLVLAGAVAVTAPTLNEMLSSPGAEAARP